MALFYSKRCHHKILLEKNNLHLDVFPVKGSSCDSQNGPTVIDNFRDNVLCRVGIRCSYPMASERESLTWLSPPHGALVWS